MSKIAFLGTSLTKAIGYGGVTTAQTFAYKIGIANGYTAANILNKGVSSDTSSGMAARLATDIIANHPDVCVVEGFLNDWATGFPVATFKSNYHSIFQALQGNGIKVVVINSGVQRGLANTAFLAQQPYLLAMEDEAAAAGIPVVDLYREILTAYGYLSTTDFNALYADDAHFTVTGNQFVANLAARAKFAGVFQP